MHILKKYLYIIYALTQQILRAFYIPETISGARIVIFSKTDIYIFGGFLFLFFFEIESVSVAQAGVLQ